MDVRLADAVVADGGQATVLFHDDPHAMNSHQQPDNVHLRTQRADAAGSRFTHSLPPHSYTLLALPLGA